MTEGIIKNQNNVTDLGLKGELKPAELTIEGSKIKSVQLIGLTPDKTYLKSTEFRSCRFTKAEFTDSVVERCNFKDCDLRNTSWRDSDFINVEFNNCNLERTDFGRIRIRKATFYKCDLRDVDFSGADIKQLDIRGCRIEGIKIHPNNYREITIDTTQAVYFASLAGLNIK